MALSFSLPVPFVGKVTTTTLWCFSSLKWSSVSDVSMRSPTIVQKNAFLQVFPHLISAFFWESLTENVFLDQKETNALYTTIDILLASSVGRKENPNLVYAELGDGYMNVLLDIFFWASEPFASPLESETFVGA